jgi:hypothetical protein
MLKKIPDKKIGLFFYITVMRKFIIAIFILLILSALFIWFTKLMEAEKGTAIVEIEIEKERTNSPNFIRTKPAGPNILKDRNENMERWKMAREKLGNCEKVRFISFDSAYCAD